MKSHMLLYIDIPRIVRKALIGIWWEIHIQAIMCAVALIP